MNLYIAFRMWYYEGEDILGVFKTKKAAIRLVEGRRGEMADEYQVRLVPTSKPVTYKDMPIVWSSRADLPPI